MYWNMSLQSICSEYLIAAMAPPVASRCVSDHRGRATSRCVNKYIVTRPLSLPRRIMVGELVGYQDPYVRTSCRPRLRLNLATELCLPSPTRLCVRQSATSVSPPWTADKRTLPLSGAAGPVSSIAFIFRHIFCMLSQNGQNAEGSCV